MKLEMLDNLLINKYRALKAYGLDRKLKLLNESEVSALIDDCAKLLDERIKSKTKS